MNLLACIIFACVIGAAGAAHTAERRPHSSPALSGVITGIEEGGKVLNIKSRNGEQRTVELPESVRVIRAIELAKVKKGDRIYAILGDVGGEMLVRRAVINGDRPRERKSEPESTRIWGKVVDVDLASRLVKINTKGGKLRTVGVGRRVRINAFIDRGDLAAGDSIVLVSQGPFDPARVMTVIVNSRCLGKL